MSEKLPALQVFSILDREKISKIMSVLDESIVTDQFHSPKLKNLERLGFTRKQSRNILECFFNLYRGLPHPDETKEFVNSLDIKDDVKQLIIESFEAMMERTDKTKVDIAITCEKLENFGHDHLHDFEVSSEFRPITKNNKLEKMVMSIIIEGSIQDAKHTKVTPINFQVDLESFESIIQELNKQLKQIKTEIKILKEKLGDDVVSV